VSGSAAADRAASDADNPYRRHWPLRPDITFLNHGSFGACPRPVLAAQARLRERLEGDPVDFLVREWPGLLSAARAALAEFVGADPADLVFVANATAGVNAVLRSLRLRPGDEILIIDHVYNACRNAARYVAERDGARVVEAAVPFPLREPEQVVEAVLARVTSRTRLALLDHVTSPTAIVLPVERLVAELAARGVDALVDGAHAPGMLPLNLRELGAAYYVGNCHKWLCAPKSAGFLVARRDRQAGLHPPVVSHGYSQTAPDRSRYQLEFDWTGTHDPSPYLCVPEATRFLGSLLPGGWPELMGRNRAQALAARDRLAAALGGEAPCPPEMLGSMAAWPAPQIAARFPGPGGDADPFQRLLWEKYGIEVPIIAWPDAGRRLVRVSAQIYNSPRDYDRLAEALQAELGS
jgi:isopenicillin-N epimerase